MHDKQWDSVKKCIAWVKTIKSRKTNRGFMDISCTPQYTFTMCRFEHTFVFWLCLLRSQTSSIYTSSSEVTSVHSRHAFHHCMHSLGIKPYDLPYLNISVWNPKASCYSFSPYHIFSCQFLDSERSLGNAKDELLESYLCAVV